MQPKHELENRIKYISIRGRMAFAIFCLEKYLEKIEVIQNPDLQKLLSNLWEFTTTNRAGEWDDTIFEYSPECILETMETKDYSYYKVLSRDTLKRYHDLYYTTSKDLA